MTVNILIQIDKLVQLLESPVFTCMCSCTGVSALIFGRHAEAEGVLTWFRPAIAIT